MRSGPLIVGKIVQSSSQRSLVPHDHVVKTLATDRAPQSFHKWILPRGSRCRKHFPHSHISGHGGEVSSVDGISIAQHKSWRLVPGKSAVWSTPLWDVPSPRSAAPGVAHALARRRRTGPGRSPSARRKNRWPRSTPDDSSGRFAKSGKAVCGVEANIWPLGIAPPQSPI